MKHNLLDIDVKLLLLRYGREEVLAALSRIGDQTPVELEKQLQSRVNNNSMGRKKAHAPSLSELAALVCRDRADIFEPLQALVIAFKNRSFLPGMRDVQRFLDAGSVSNSKYKSRAAAGRDLIRALSTLPKEELTSLLPRDTPAGESDFARLSRAIMGKPYNDTKS
jgi:hypothetical protein